MDNADGAPGSTQKSVSYRFAPKGTPKGGKVVRVMFRFLCYISLVPFVFSCAGLSERVRLSKFDQTTEAYVTALKRSQYGPAQSFIAPSFRNEEIDFETYKNVKIVDFGVVHVTISDDRFRVEQDVVLQYFLLDRNIVKTRKYKQVWYFDEEKGNWFLHTPLPAFGN